MLTSGRSVIGTATGLAELVNLVSVNSLPLWSVWSQENPDSKALILPERTLSWVQLEETVNQIAAVLHQQGVVSGEVIAAISKNCAELLLLYLAAIKLGAVVAFIAPAPLRQLEGKIETLSCSYIWLGREADRYGSTDPLIHLRGRDRSKPVVELSEYGLFRSHQSNAGIVNHGCTSLGLTSIVFTSGSTGAPKAVAHTQSAHLASAQGLLKQFKFECTDIWLLSLPMYHVSGLAIFWRWLSVGGCLKVAKGEDLIEDLSGVTHASLVPTQLKRILDSERPLSLQRVLLGGSYIPEEIAQRASTLGIDTWLGYGMTEAASTVTAKRYDGKPGVGTQLTQREIRLAGQRVLIGGATLASGYYLQGQLIPITENGWFDSKDLGEYSSGQLIIHGRADNLFISGGKIFTVKR